jgi:hypothetical protein
MKRVGTKIAALSLGLVGCASLESAPITGAEVVNHGLVVGRTEGTARTGETRAARAAWAALGLSPVNVIAAVVAVEEGFGTTNVFNYEIDLKPSGQRIAIQSQYPAKVGQCLVIRTNQTTGQIVIFEEPAEKCSG